MIDNRSLVLVLPLNVQCAVRAISLVSCQTLRQIMKRREGSSVAPFFFAWITLLQKMHLVVVDET